MKIDYCDSKEVNVYKAFVTHPEDRKARTAFMRCFGKELMEPASKLHERLTRFKNAARYNEVFGKTKNRIEFAKGQKHSNPFILKVRVSGSHRKFFHHVTGQGEYLKAGEWTGDFDAIEEIFVVSVNKHDYAGVLK